MAEGVSRAVDSDSLARQRSLVFLRSMELILIDSERYQEGLFLGFR